MVFYNRYRIDSNMEDEKSPKKTVRRRKKTDNNNDNDIIEQITQNKQEPSPIMTRRSSSFLRQTALVKSGLTNSREEQLPRSVSVGDNIKNNYSGQNSPRSSSPRSSISTPRSLNSSPRKHIITPPLPQPNNDPFNVMTGKINVREQLGGGGSANVYKVDIDGVVMAAKKYHDLFYDDESGGSSTSLSSSTESFKNDTKRNMQQKLDALCALPPNPYIVKIFGYRFTEELIVMSELMDCTLRSMIGDQYNVKKKFDKFIVEVPPFSKKITLDFFEQIVACIVFLHNIPQPCNLISGGTVTAIWHRDLKSENVLVNMIRSFDKSASIQYHLKICDFDEAHIEYDKADPSSPIQWYDSDVIQTLHRSVNGRRKGMFSTQRERLSATVGTTQFMAPEIIYSESTTYNEKVDIWSLGMILYELLTMELPYNCDGYNKFDLLKKIQSGVRPIIPRGYLDDPEWQPILKLFMDCTELDPNVRPSATKLLKRIKELNLNL